MIHYPFVDHSLSLGIILPPLIIFVIFFFYFIKLLFTEQCNTDLDDANDNNNNNNNNSNPYHEVTDGDSEAEQRGSKRNSKSGREARRSLVSENYQYQTSNLEEAKEGNLVQRTTGDPSIASANNTTQQNEAATTVLVSTTTTTTTSSSSYSLPVPTPKKISAFLNWCRRLRVININNATLGVTLLILLAQSPSRYLFQECFQWDNELVQNSTLFSVTPQAAIGSPFYYFCYGITEDSPFYGYDKASSSAYDVLPDNFTITTNLLSVVTTTSQKFENGSNSSSNSITTARPNCPFLIENVTFVSKLMSSGYRDSCNYRGRSSTRSAFSDWFVGDDSRAATMAILSSNANRPPADLVGDLPSRPVDLSPYNRDVNFTALFILLISSFGVWGTWLLVAFFQIFVTLCAVPKEKRSGYDWGLMCPGFIFLLVIIRPVMCWKYFGMKSRDTKNENVVDHDDDANKQQSSGDLPIATATSSTSYGTVRDAAAENKNNDEDEHQPDQEFNNNNNRENIESVPGELSYEMCNTRVTNFLTSLYSIFFVTFVICFLICAKAYGWFLSPVNDIAASIGLIIGLVLCSFQFAITFIPAVYNFFDFIVNRGPRLIRREFVLFYWKSCSDLPFGSTFQKVKKIYTTTALLRRLVNLMTTCVRIIYAVLLFSAFMQLRDVYKDPTMKYAYAAQIMSYIVLTFETCRQFGGFFVVFSGWFEEKVGTRNGLGFLKDSTLALFASFLMDPEKNVIEYFFRRCEYEDEFATTSNYYVRVFITVGIEFCHCYDALVANILQGQQDEKTENNNNNGAQSTTTTTTTQTSTTSTSTTAPSSSSSIPDIFKINLSKDVTKMLAVFSLVKVGGSFLYLIYRQSELDYEKHKKEEQERLLLPRTNNQKTKKDNHNNNPNSNEA